MRNIERRIKQKFEPVQNWMADKAVNAWWYWLILFTALPCIYFFVPLDPFNSPNSVISFYLSSETLYCDFYLASLIFVIVVSGMGIAGSLLFFLDRRAGMKVLRGRTNFLMQSAAIMWLIFQIPFLFSTYLYQIFSISFLSFFTLTRIILGSISIIVLWSIFGPLEKSQKEKKLKSSMQVSASTTDIKFLYKSRVWLALAVVLVFSLVPLRFEIDTFDTPNFLEITWFSDYYLIFTRFQGDYIPLLVGVILIPVFLPFSLVVIGALKTKNGLKQKNPYISRVARILTKLGIWIWIIICFQLILVDLDFGFIRKILYERYISSSGNGFSGHYSYYLWFISVTPDPAAESYVWGWKFFITPSAWLMLIPLIALAVKSFEHPRLKAFDFQQFSKTSTKQSKAIDDHEFDLETKFTIAQKSDQISREKNAPVITLGVKAASLIFFLVGIPYFIVGYVSLRGWDLSFFIPIQGIFFLSLAGIYFCGAIMLLKGIPEAVYLCVFLAGLLIVLSIWSLVFVTISGKMTNLKAGIQIFWLLCGFLIIYLVGIRKETQMVFRQKQGEK